MTDPVYGVQPTPNYRIWAGAGALLLLVLAVIWSVFLRSAPDPAIEAAAPQLAQPPQALPPLALRPATAPTPPLGAVATSDVETPQLRARIAALEAEVAAGRAQIAAYQLALGQAGSQLTQAGVENERMRAAVESPTRNSTPIAPARKADVRHLGEPSLTPVGTSWLVAGVWYNVGTAPASGTAEVQLLVDGRPTGSPQTVPVGALAPGATAGYQALFNTQLESQGHQITAAANWQEN